MWITQYLCCAQKMNPGSGSETSKDLFFENRGRKCICCVDQWVKNKKKSKKDSDKAYRTYRSQRISRKQSASSLSCRCQHHCSSLVTVADMKWIFNTHKPKAVGQFSFVLLPASLLFPCYSG